MARTTKTAGRATKAPAKPPTARRSGVAASVDEYLERLAAPERGTLQKLRADIRKAAPQAREVISYQIPTYLLNGPLVHFAAQPKHLSLTVISLDVITSLRRRLSGFQVSGRTIRFSPERPLPAGLVRAIVKARIRENDARAR